jgi:hypothetical protein
MPWLAIMEQFKYTFVSIVRLLEETWVKLIGCSEAREGLAQLIVRQPWFRRQIAESQQVKR